MSDLVQRVREYLESPANAPEDISLVIEVADEIERLQAEVQALKPWHWRCDTHGAGNLHAWGCPECVREMRLELQALKADALRMEDALERIKSWSLAYPLSVFPEPDMARAHEALQTVGITLDAVSASNMRHVITQVQQIADSAMAEPLAAKE